MLNESLQTTNSQKTFRIKISSKINYFVKKWRPWVRQKIDLVLGKLVTLETGVGLGMDHLKMTSECFVRNI